MVVGHPLTHSLSPLLHNYIYRKLGLDAVMLAFPHPQVEGVVSAARSLGVPLTAVTIPHKETVSALVDEVDEVAKAVGAVNTVINRQGRLYGYNTDVVGVSYALRSVSLGKKNVLVVGAGGAARAVAYFLREKDANIFYLNRTADKAQVLADKFGGTVIDTAALSTTTFDLVVNTTPIGMYPRHQATPLPDFIFNSDQTVFDIVYNPLETILLRSARQQRASIISGLTMFIAQALEQVRLLSGQTMSFKQAEDYLLTKIQNKQYELHGN